jgi:hypothetical protein
MLLSSRRLFIGTTTAFVLVTGAGIFAHRATVTAAARNSATVAAARFDLALGQQSDETRAIALAYFERTRLGLGSPFRLIDQAMHDPRLPDRWRGPSSIDCLTAACTRSTRARSTS